MAFEDHLLGKFLLQGSDGLQEFVNPLKLHTTFACLCTWLFFWQKNNFP